MPGQQRLVLDGIVFSLQRQGGISVYFRELLKRLLRDGTQATLLLDGTLQQEVPAGGPSLVLEHRPSRLLERYRNCRIPPDTAAGVFHSTYYRRPAGNRLPTVVTVHDFTYERFASGPRRWVHMAQKRAAIRAAQAVICISQATKSDLERWIGVRPDQQVHVIPNGVGDVFRPLSLVSTPPRPYVLFVGARSGYKNFRLALQALASLPALELHCVGGGTLRAEELAVVPQAVRTRVRHLGHIDDESLNHCYNSAVCLLYPSSHEGFGIPVLEAMRAGCPVVCIACNAVLEIGGDALVVAASDALALAEAIGSVCDRQRRAAVVAAGLAVARCYSWQMTYERTLQVYRNLGAAVAKAAT